MLEIYYHKVLESRNRTGSTGSRNPENKNERERGKVKEKG